MIVNKQLAKNY